MAFRSMVLGSAARFNSKESSDLINTFDNTLISQIENSRHNTVIGHLLLLVFDVNDCLGLD